jgi:hypothetical protein
MLVDGMMVKAWLRGASSTHCATGCEGRATATFEPDPREQVRVYFCLLTPIDGGGPKR